MDTGIGALLSPDNARLASSHSKCALRPFHLDERPRAQVNTANPEATGYRKITVYVGTPPLLGQETEHAEQLVMSIRRITRAGREAARRPETHANSSEGVIDTRPYQDGCRHNSLGALEGERTPQPEPGSLKGATSSR